MADKEQQIVNLKLYSVGMTAVAAVLLAFLLRCCTMGTNCPEATTIKETITVQKVDEAKALPFIIKRVPVPGRTVFQRDTFFVFTKGDTVPHLFIDSCADAVAYRDSVYIRDSFKLVILDTVQHNHLQGREISFTDLSPTIIQTIEKVTPMKERWRVYVGVFGGYSKPYSGAAPDFAIGPQLLLTIPQGLAITYGFDAKRNGHTVGALYKISLRKK